jgi:2-methylcitrate dehydratase PrpD
MTIAQGLADRSHSVRYATLPEDALHWARVAILDTVGVTLGNVVSRRVNQPIGRDAEHPLPQDLLEAKFMSCATRALPSDTARHLLALLPRLDDVPRIIHLTAAMLPVHRAAV